MQIFNSQTFVEIAFLIANKLGPAWKAENLRAKLPYDDLFACKFSAFYALKKVFFSSQTFLDLVAQKIDIEPLSDLIC